MYIKNLKHFSKRFQGIDLNDAMLLWEMKIPIDVWYNNSLCVNPALQDVYGAADENNIVSVQAVVNDIGKVMNFRVNLDSMVDHAESVHKYPGIEIEAVSNKEHVDYVNPIDEGSEFKKHDLGKLRYDLIPPELLKELAKIYTVGSLKYGDNTWQGIDEKRYQAALMRHFEDYREGKTFNVETDKDGKEYKVRTLAQVAWNAFTLMHKENERMQKESEKEAQMSAMIRNLTNG